MAPPPTDGYSRAVRASNYRLLTGAGPDPCRGTNRGTRVPAPKTRLAHVKTLARNSSQHASRLGIVPLATSPKRSMGHLLGGEKIIFLIRDIDGPAMAAAPVESCQDRGPEVSLGSPRVGTIHVQSPTPHTPPLQAYFGQFSQQTKSFSLPGRGGCFRR